VSFTGFQIDRRNGLISAILRINNVVFLVETPCSLVGVSSVLEEHSASYLIQSAAKNYRFDLCLFFREINR
jgi:hypothetical protein